MMMIWKIAPALAAGNTHRAQAERHHAGVLHAARRAVPGVPAARRAQRGHRRPRHRPGAGRAPDPAAGRDHRLGARRHARSPAPPPPTSSGSHLELGGKAPVVVFDDADVEAAAEGIAGAGYFNAGQDCTAATRVLAGPGRPRRLRRRADRAGQGHARPGMPDNEDILYGPLNNANQLAHVSGMVDRLPDHARHRDRRPPPGRRGLLLRADRRSPASSRTTSRSRPRSSAR